LALTELQFHEALGIAEYHGPRGPMMRCIDYPTMVKDGATWGAPSGVTAAYLARQGFTGAPAELLTAQPVSELWSDLGVRWRMLDQYFKPYPVCRWAQPAIQAALALRENKDFDASLIEEVEVQTFMQAARLGKEMPGNTERAQYNLGYPLACALVRGRVSAAELQPASWEDGSIREMLEKIRLVEDEQLTRRFPSERIARVKMRLLSGKVLEQSSETTLGDPATPLSDQAVELKARDALQAVLPSTAVQPLLDRLWNFANETDARGALSPLWGTTSLA
jgi:2-methylcitrate dehydratase PrpD